MKARSLQPTAMVPNPSIERTSTAPDPRTAQVHHALRGLKPVASTHVKRWAARKLVEQS